MAIKQTFFGLDAATLASLKTKYIEALEAVAVAGQSYSISNRSFTRANLSEIKDTLAEIQSAIDYTNGTAVTTTLPSFRR